MLSYLLQCKKEVKALSTMRDPNNTSQPFPSTINDSSREYSDLGNCSSQSLLICSCEAAEVERKMINLQQNATEALNSTYQQISGSEMQLAGRLKEIHELNEELLNVEKEEREILSRIQGIEHRKHQNEITAGEITGDTDMKEMKLKFTEELSSEIKQRDAKIEELESELLQNTKWLQRL